jgi:hypothetical protein
MRLSLILPAFPLAAQVKFPVSYPPANDIVMENLIEYKKMYLSSAHARTRCMGTGPGYILGA